MKKNRLKHSLLKAVAISVGTIVLSAGFVACDADRQDRSRPGQLRLTLATDTTSQKKGVSGSTRGVALGDEFAQFLTTSDYRIRIVQGKDTVKAYERFDEMPSEVALEEGTYTLVAYKGNNLPASFESPYFEGNTDFAVKADMSTPIDVTCTLGNARLTVEYTDDFKEVYSDYTVLLSSPFTAGNFEIKKEELRPAYMQVAKDGSELGVAITLKKTGETKEQTYTIPAAIRIERRQHVHLIFKTDSGSGQGVGLDVVLDDEMTDVGLWEGIPDFMWQQFEKPLLVAENFAEGGFSIGVGQEDLEDLLKNLNVGFTVKAGIRNFYIDRWIEGDEENVLRYDLATDEGLKNAQAAGFVLSEKLQEKANLYGLRGGGQIYLSDAIARLNLSDDEVKTTIYHFRFQVSDTLPKTNYSNVVNLKVTVTSPF